MTTPPSPMMWVVRTVAVLASFAMIAAACGGTDERPTGSDAPAPGDAWVRSTPSQAGFAPDALNEIVTDLERPDNDVHRVIAIRDGHLGLDANVWPSPSSGVHELSTLTTSIVALVVVAAVEAGDLGSLDDELGDYVDLPARSPAAAISLRDVLGMRTGLACSDQNGERALGAMLDADDYVAEAATIARQRAPGERYTYCAPAYHLLSAAISETTGLPLADYADQVLFDPLGIDGWLWPDDREGVSLGWDGLELDPSDLARIGQLIVDDGVVNGRRILPEGFVTEARSDRVRLDDEAEFGLGWRVPEDTGPATLEARGRGGQTLFVDAEAKVVIVIVGAGPDRADIARSLGQATRVPPEPDLAADGALSERLTRLAEPPDPSPTTAPGPGARTGETIPVDDNDRGVTSMTTTPFDATTVEVQLQVDPVTVYLRVAVDGVADIEQISLTDRPAALTGSWSGSVFTVDHEEVLGTDHLRIVLDIGNPARLSVTDLTTGRTPTRARER